MGEAKKGASPVFRQKQQELTAACETSDVLPLFPSPPSGGNAAHAKKGTELRNTGNHALTPVLLCVWSAGVPDPSMGREIRPSASTRESRKGRGLGLGVGTPLEMKAGPSHRVGTWGRVEHGDVACVGHSVRYERQGV